MVIRLKSVAVPEKSNAPANFEILMEIPIPQGYLLSNNPIESGYLLSNLARGRGIEAGPERKSLVPTRTYM